MTDHKFPVSARSLVASEVELFTEIDLYMAIASELTVSAIAVATHPIATAWTDFADTVAMLTEGTGEILEELGQSRPVLFAQTIVPTIALFAEMTAPKISAAWSYARPRLIKTIAMLAATVVAIAKVWVFPEFEVSEDPVFEPAMSFQEFRDLEAELTEVLALTTKNSAIAADLMGMAWNPSIGSDDFAADLMAGGYLDPQAVLTSEIVASAIESPRRKKRGLRTGEHTRR